MSEIQDQDLFYHNIGASIENAKQADIIILGSSLATFGFDSATLEKTLGERYGLKFYNMAFIGVASGEFVKRIIKKYDIHPWLWIINADDGGGNSNFFSRDVIRAFCADVKVIAATKSSRMQAFMEVVRRNIRWRIEDLMAGLPVPDFIRPASQSLIPQFNRNIRTGGTDMSSFPHYLAEDNPGVKITRSPDCHTTPEIVAIARDYVREIGGKVELTLIPNLYSCPQQARELAAALGTDLLLPPRDDYSSWDKGGHLDRRGAVQLTEDIVSALEKTDAFKSVIAKP